MNSKPPFLLCGANNIQHHSIIFNNQIPSCKNCIYYNPDWLNKEFTNPYNKCAKFGEKDIVTGIITYEFAEQCRKDESKCGLVGKYFVEDQHIQSKLWLHALVSKSYYLFPIIALILAVYSTNKH
jgi:hypothetical protein